MTSESASDQPQAGDEPLLVKESEDTSTTTHNGTVTETTGTTEQGDGTKQEDDVEADDDEEEEEDAKAIFLHNLCILPPLQKDPNQNLNNDVITKDAVLLPSIGPTEPVSAIRGALAEIRGYAHITNYRLVIEDIDDDVHQSIVESSKSRAKETLAAAAGTGTTKSSKKKNSGGGTNGSSGGGSSGGGSSKQKKKKGSSSSASSVPVQDVVSAYTSSKAVIAVSSSELSLDFDAFQKQQKSSDGEEKDKQEIVLNDFGDLSTYVESNELDSNMGFRMVLERYDVGLVKEHVIKTRFLLDGNAPCVLRVVGDDGDEVDDEGAENDAAETAPDNKNGEGSTENKQKEEEKIDTEELKIPDLQSPVCLDGSNLKDFFYLTCGEEERLKILNGGKASKFIDLQKARCETEAAGNDEKDDDEANETIEAQNMALRWSELDDLCNIKCKISYGGFNPPPAHRRLLGDLAYLEVQLPGTSSEDKIHITAIPAGFYVNRSTAKKFDPSPSSDPCFSHELLDCLLQKSASLRLAWSEALRASLERSDLASSNDSPVEALFRAVVKRDLNKTNDVDSSARQQIDTLTLRPSWLVHSSQNDGGDGCLHSYNIERSEDDLGNSYGVDVGSGVARDWNEELQSAREMSCETLNEKIERARIVHKTLLDFADAAVAGATAIFKGQISPMNPNEVSRSHVYLHNNIFFSRAIDAGVDTFKVAQGDNCARKAASLDAQSVGTLHRLDIEGLNTLATVLIDYLGTRLICQSIVPGILQGDKFHDILYGSVEATAPLAYDKEMHEVLEKRLGKGLMIATRNIQKKPLSQERMEYIEERKTPPIFGTIQKPEDDAEAEEVSGTTPFFGPIEMKGIRGSDRRTYCLDITRLTPRDANWVPKEVGGTGHYESMKQDKNKCIPDTLEDDEWIMAVLRPELIIHITHKKMREYIEGKKTKEAEANSNGDQTPDGDAPKDPTVDDTEYMDSLRLNLNVFLPHLKGTDGMSDSDIEQLKKDESLVREAADYLWNTVLPRINQDVRSGKITSLPADGRGLTEFLHQRGVNCRYLGRLAEMALVEEIKSKAEELQIKENEDVKDLKRYKMPLCWLELLECEMVSRAAKHVLDRYLTKNGCVSASQPGPEIASFLSALMITAEESAAETERRLDGDDENEQSSSSVFSIDDDMSIKRGHKEIWADIDKEVGRRFRYSLRLFNSKDASYTKRSPYIPLLRRFCQKTGIRLKAKDYSVGKKGLVSSSVPYPISVSDIVEVVPLVKHAASSGDDGFIACASGAAAASTSLHILLPEAKAAFDAAQVHLNEKRLQPALDLIQEATNLYQRVVESPFHNRVYRCLELTSIILFQAQELDMALANANKALAIAIQIGGFDSKEVLSSRTTLSHILLNTSCLASAVKQQRATMYLMELMAGPRYVELSNSYHKLGTIYHEIGSPMTALRLYQEAFSRYNPDRVVEGMLSKHCASILAALGHYKSAFETEKRTNHFFKMALGEDHELTKSSVDTMKTFMTLTVQAHEAQEAIQKIQLEKNQKREEEEAAIEIGNKIVADEAAAEERKKKKKKKSNKKKK